MRLLLLELLLLAVGVTDSRACQCPEPPRPQEALERATAVFVGTVISAALAGDRGRRFQFSVKEVLKGNIGGKVDVLTGRGGGDCGYNFNIATQYLVYATFSEGQLATNICMRTKEYNPDGKKEADEFKAKP
jgi:hypothetical protein